MEFKASLALIAPEILLSLSGLALLLVAAWSGDKASRTISVLACVALGACFFLVAPAVCAGAAGPDTMAFGGQFRADAFAGFAKLMIFAASGAVLIVAPSFLERTGSMRAEFPVLVLFATLGMSIMVSATDLLTLYIGLELNSLSAYVLAAFLRSDNRSAEAGLKYFVLGALASGILLFGMSLTYGFTGTTSFEGIRVALDGELATGALFGLIFVLAGLAFKMSAVPFHMWTPDVYEGAPTPVTAFFATAPKVAAVALTARVALDPFGMQADAWQQIVVFAALASIVVGALGAIGQSNVKRLLAYSSINNIGFILIGLATGTLAGASAMLVYLAIYVAMTVGSFVAVLMLRDADGNPVEAISDLAGLSTTRPALAWCLMALMFSTAGIPPLFGFWGKFVVFRAAVEADLIVLAALGIAASVIGAFYYIKIVKIMFFDEPANKVVGKSDWSHWALLAISTVFISPLGYLLTGWLGDLADSAAASLLLLA
ncbi:NADH-quinone oxidoreductase subunit N [Altererythrobacter atlanticus]|uniref:NADH-quinone oxidoreductase subunit N n=1 Tax=Croceibacterium atlanticum TaxID=1267766 RepID=A0A0F7KR66_9SPHN|nr:NADH-quinone oxidoreductase subunit NuoN [Croceibacterium atlanticum]AKH41677.1 NADH-quinone oxidoreductase subunit N [Croceibacterium atlanticum]MBB5733141.1 NADH-quinone oxidoreductase subunit N [Croceibacterium atlanticum]